MSNKDSIVVVVKGADNFTRCALAERIEGHLGTDFSDVNNGVSLEDESQASEGTLFDALLAARGPEVLSTPIYIEEDVGDGVEEPTDDEEGPSEE